MAGILANSATKTMTDGDTAVDKAVSGYLRNEQITLTATGSPSSHSWGIAKPSGSTARSNLNDDDVAQVVFTPDEPGYYVITCLVDGTTEYVIRIAVIDVVTLTSREGLRLTPIAEASVPAPALGAVLFWSEDSDALKQKLSDGTVETITVS